MRVSLVGRLVVCALLVAGFVALGSVVNTPPSDATTNVSVSTVPYVVQGPCSSSNLVLSNRVVNTPEAFTVTITANAPLCNPVFAKAVVYLMPGDGVAWPQKLAAIEPFTIDKAGVYTVTFVKGCDPAQFDIVTGAAPGTITPGGAAHGPLLFPDTNTALQWWGRECPEPTTTTGSTTSTSTTGVTTSTTSTTSSTTTTPTSTSSTTTTAPVPTTVPQALPAPITPGTPKVAG